MESSSRRELYDTTALKKALQRERAEADARQWAADNKDAINAYNTLVEELGCFSDEFREF